MSYVVAAYGITAGTLALYAFALMRERLRLTREARTRSDARPKTRSLDQE